MLTVNGRKKPPIRISSPPVPVHRDELTGDYGWIPPATPWTIGHTIEEVTTTPKVFENRRVARDSWETFASREATEMALRLGTWSDWIPF